MRTKFLRRALVCGLSGALLACGGGSDSDGGNNVNNGNNSSGGNDGGGSAGQWEFPLQPRASLIVDVNNDGLNDLIVDTDDSESDTRDLLLINQGNLNFEPRPDALPLRFTGQSDLAEEGTTVAMESGDFNGDGNVDILAIAVSAGYEESKIQLFFGDGNGSFSDASAGVSPNQFSGWPERARVADFDNNGYDDFILSTSGPCEDICGRIYLNDAEGNLTPAAITFTDVNDTFTADVLTWDDRGNVVREPLSRPTPHGGDILVGDLDQDGMPDLLYPALDYMYIPSFINTSTPGNLSFTIKYTEGIPYDVQESLGYPEIHNAILADINGDTFPDLIGSKAISYDVTTVPVHTYLNDGSGTFILEHDRSAAGVGVVHAREWHAVDVDGNGSEEVVIADHGYDQQPFPGAPNLLLFYNSEGLLENRASTALSAVNSFSHGASVGDLNGDGAVDIFFNNAWSDGLDAASEERFWINKADGSGEFEAVEPTFN
ncbi:VCBS repeat-containing protein [Microbulbifer sp. CAU 1566]|uniref:FG-GAP repeat domain-containing protein n=1 Tax=Microbulbifer sp. CAU 1566 TaxID=2933269 RepID=UPI002005826A|nr:VCBS repeat-containing protein [Microbulbifer sp. CAU 1566]MCK7597877.1 VCBS repeat-containing protein [Microbulbifer sp. CAU 1566]